MMYPILYREFEHLDLGICGVALKPIPQEYRGTTKFLEIKRCMWIFFCAGRRELVTQSLCCLRVSYYLPNYVLEQCDEAGNVITTIFYVGKISNKLNNLSTDSLAAVAELGFL